MLGPELVLMCNVILNKALNLVSPHKPVEYYVRNLVMTLLSSILFLKLQDFKTYLGIINHSPHNPVHFLSIMLVIYLGTMLSSILFL